MTDHIYPVLIYKLSNDTFLGLTPDSGYTLTAAVSLTREDLLETLHQKEVYFEGFRADNSFKMDLLSVEISGAETGFDFMGCPNCRIKMKVPVVFGVLGSAFRREVFQAFMLTPYNWTYLGRLPKLKRNEWLLEEIKNKLKKEASLEFLTRLAQLPTPTISHITHSHEYKDFDNADVPGNQTRQGNKSKGLFPDWALERDRESAQVREALQSGQNVLVTGQAGVGKSTILRVALRDAGKKIERRDARDIQGKGEYLGEWQEHFDRFVKEMRRKGDHVLWLDDLAFLENWKYGEAVLDYMGVYMKRRQLQVVGEMTPDEFASLRARYPHFIRLFKEIHIAPFSDESRRNIYSEMISHLHKNWKIKLAEDDLDYVGRLLQRFLPDLLFPGGLTSFLERAVDHYRQSKSQTLDRELLVEAFADFTGLSPFFLKNNLLVNEKELEDYFKSKIIGQPDVVRALCDLVKIFKSELNDPGKPMAVLHFVGPTGVGKTKSAQVLAEYFLGQGTADSPLIRVDMSEYKDGFWGVNQEDSPLVKGLKKKKFSVILLDEFDKADRNEAFRLMNAFDEGRMKDQTGQILNFRNSIIILTSNIGSNVQRVRVPGQTIDPRKEYFSEVKKFFPPEIFNRIDRHIYFNHLNQDHIRQITRLELEKLPSEHVGMAERNLKIAFSDALVETLAKNGFDEKYGARPLQRTIRNTVVTAISQSLNRNPGWKNGTLCLDFKQDVGIDFQRD